MGPPEFWIIAGPNGAGKSTFVQAEPLGRLLPHVRFLNPDDLARERLTAAGWRGFADAPAAEQRAAFLAAAEAVAAQTDFVLARGEAAGVETVLSTDKYRVAVERVRDAAGFVGLIYIGLATPQLACARVSRRAGEGGHAVPPEKIAARWHRSLAHLPWFAKRASAFWIFDNSNEDPVIPPLLAAHGADGHVNFLASSAPAWVRTALATLLP